MTQSLRSRIKDQQQFVGGDSRRSLFNPPAADLKARLMAVADSMASAMKGGGAVYSRTEQAAAALRGAVANIEANQVVSVRGSEQATSQSSAQANVPANAQAATWRMDLPVVDTNGHQALQLRIDREPRGTSDNSHDVAWIARITIQPPGQEPVHARIALNGGAVYTTFSTTDKALAKRIKSGETQLRKLFDVVHLSLAGMRCLADEPGLGSEDLPHSALVSEHV